VWTFRTNSPIMKYILCTVRYARQLIYLIDAVRPPIQPAGFASMRTVRSAIQTILLLVQYAYGATDLIIFPYSVDSSLVGR
jgi:hypothetical protein